MSKLMKYSEQLKKIAKTITANCKLIRITDQDFNKLPNVIYHSTPYYNVDDIIKSGLGNVHVDYMEGKKGFFFATDDQNSEMYGNYEGAKTVTFAIQKSKLDKNKIYYDQNDCYTDDYVTLLKGEQFSWCNGQELETLEEQYLDANEYWNINKYLMCFFYDGIIKVSEKDVQ